MKKTLLIRFFILGFSAIILSSSFALAQIQEWAAIYNDTANQTDEANVLYVDASGNSYAAGYAGENMIVVKYDSIGNQLWASINVGVNGSSYANAISVDGAGDVFITGSTTNIDSGSFIVIKYNAAGLFQWQRFLGIPGSFLDDGIAITTDTNYVYVTGSVFPGLPPWWNYRTVKLDIVTGAVQSGWPQDYNGTGNNEDVPASIAIDVSGNIFVTGYSVNGSGDKDYLTIGYTASGSILPGWPQRYNGTGDSDDVPVQLLVSGNNVYVTGASMGIGSGWDILTIVYTYSGDVVSGWPQRYNGTGNGWDAVGSTESSASYKPMAVDASGNVYVTGWTTNDSSNYDIITFRYNAAGVVQSGWPQIYDNSGNDDISRGLALDASNDVCITGFTGTLSNGNYVTIEYDPSGNTMPGWPVMYNGSANGDDEAQAICVVGENIWVTGYATDAGTSADITTIKYSNSNLTVGIRNFDSMPIPVIVSPNPSTGRYIFNNVAKESLLTVTNVLGEVIYKSKVATPQTQIDISGESKGIYFYKIISEGKSFAEGKLELQ